MQMLFYLVLLLLFLMCMCNNTAYSFIKSLLFSLACVDYDSKFGHEQDSFQDTCLEEDKNC